MNGAEGIAEYVLVFEHNLVSLPSDGVKDLGWIPFVAVPSVHDITLCDLNLNRCRFAGSDQTGRKHRPGQPDGTILTFTMACIEIDENIPGGAVALF